ncbi:MAG: endonuclease V [Thermoguttaceae bacterium]
MLDEVPPGRVTTPGGLAAALGNPVAARWIGHFLLHHAHDAACPCHRVVRCGGAVGPALAGELGAKIERLRAEGVTVRDATVDLAVYGFAEFVCDRPLARLARLQQSLSARVRTGPRKRVPRLIGGVDVSYPSPAEGVAAYALVDAATGELIWSATVRRPVRFPYITSYLTFRELPILLDLLAEVRRAGRLAPVLLVDGTGILHPRHAGIASHLGVVAGLPTIGLTKKLLCGAVDLAGLRPLESRPVVYQGHPIGVALRPTAGSRRPLFVSPGHRTDLPFAERVVRGLLTGFRLPTPIYWADRLSRQAASNC